VAIGAYTPFGLATTYDEDFTRFAAKRSELKTIYVTPAASWRPSEYFSVGVGMSFVHASGMFTRAICLNPGGCGAAPDPGEATLRLTDTTNAFAYNVGLLVKPIKDWKFGFGYRGRVDLRFKNADVKLGGPALPGMNLKADVKPLALPPVINAGAYWQITPSWGTEFVYEYARWSEFKSLKASFASGPLPGFSLPQDWKNTSTFRLGTSYTLNKNWELLGGAALEETPIPSRTLNPAIPGGDTLTLNAGIEYKWQQLSFGIGYMAIFMKTRTVTNNELEGLPATGLPFTGAPGKDTHRIYDNWVTASIAYRF
jgi:long-chain fatty acid transport protein